MEKEQEYCDHFNSQKFDEGTDYDLNGIYEYERFECLMCGKIWNKKEYKE